jgi:hypothetical protein
MTVTECYPKFSMAVLTVVCIFRALVSKDRRGGERSSEDALLFIPQPQHRLVKKRGGACRSELCMLYGLLRLWRDNPAEDSQSHLE